MKEEVIETIKIARILYNAVTFISIAVFVYYDTDLQKSFLSLDFPYLLCFFALIRLCFYMFYNCKHNPGFVELPNDCKSNQVELSIAREGSRSMETRLAAVPDSKIQIEEIKARSSERETELNGFNYTRKKSAEKEQFMPAMKFCNECKVTQPFRAKHCKLCERCVHKFDHHCYWLGGCIGELNHRKFWFFLLVQSILELWMCIIANSGLQVHNQLRIENIKAWTRKNNSYPISEYEILMIVTIAIYIAFLLTSFLFIFHTFLILTNQTTWEFLKREKISYLKAYPQGFHPFNKGYKTNLRLIFLHENRIRNWELPPLENGLKEKDQRTNWVKNSYALFNKSVYLIIAK